MRASLLWMMMFLGEIPPFRRCRVSALAAHVDDGNGHPFPRYSFAGKRALVTGSSGGIGAGIARALAERGARVMLHYNAREAGARSTRNEIVEGGGTCDGMIRCDFRNPGDIRRMMEAVYGEWNDGIDILVNNAGLITKLAAGDEDDDLASWMDTMQVNVNAPYQLSRLAYEKMRHQDGGGNIINISSIHGSISTEYMVAYAASKAAMDRMTAGLSNEWAREGVRVNAVAPGIVPVERTEAVLSQPSVRDVWMPHLPVGRMGTVEECAHSVVYLCENQWSTGTILTLDGGMTARINMPFRAKPTPATQEKRRDGIEFTSFAPE